MARHPAAESTRGAGGVAKKSLRIPALKWRRWRRSAGGAAARPDARHVGEPGVVLLVGETTAGAARSAEEASREHAIGDGTLNDQFFIDGEPNVGAVVDEATIAADSMLRNHDLEECVRETMHTAQLPAPHDGGRIRVS